MEVFVSGEGEGRMGIYGILLTGLFFLAILGLLLLYFRKKRLTEENYNLAVQQQLLAAHYDAVREQVERERRFRHDSRYSIVSR